jgi:hypothetical protein
MRRTVTQPGFKEGPVPDVRLILAARKALWKIDSKRYSNISHGDVLELSPAIRAKLKREGLTPEFLSPKFRVIGRD